MWCIFLFVVMISMHFSSMIFGLHRVLFPLQTSLFGLEIGKRKIGPLETLVEARHCMVFVITQGRYVLQLGILKYSRVPIRQGHIRVPLLLEQSRTEPRPGLPGPGSVRDPVPYGN